MSHQPAATMFRGRPRTRWAAAVAGVAAVAFVVGLLAGHLAHDLPLDGGRPPGFMAEGASTPPPRVVPTTFSEDEFLGQIELAAARNGPAALRPLDAMTPRAWEVR